MLEHLDDLLPVLVQNMVPIAGGVTIGLLSGAWIAYHWKTKAIRGKAMLRKKEVNTILADVFVDAMLEAHAAGQLTAKEVNDECHKYAKQRGLWDLMPRQLIKEPDQASLKERLQQKWEGVAGQTKSDDAFATLLVANLK